LGPVKKNLKNHEQSFNGFSRQSVEANMRYKSIVVTIVALLTFSSLSPLSTRAFAAPQAASIEESPVWRAQIRITTNTPGAGRFLEVSLNPANKTKLYAAYSDVGTSYGYDLILDNVRRLSDITWIQIYKPNAGSWRFKTITLLVNGRAVYNIDYSGSGLWMAQNSYYFTFFHQLRNHPLWRAYTLPATPQMISAAEIMHRVESLAGDFIAGDALRSGWLPAPLFWRTEDPYTYAVKVNGNGQQRLHIQLDLKYYQALEYSVEVEFDLEFSCANGKLFVALRDLDMSGYPVIDGLTQNNKLLFTLFLQTAMPLKLMSSLQAMTFTDDLGQPACPPVRVVGNSVYLF
jgi:hypothetical protein